MRHTFFSSLVCLCVLLPSVGQSSKVAVGISELLDLVQITGDELPLMVKLLGQDVDELKKANNNNNQDAGKLLKGASILQVVVLEMKMQVVSCLSVIDLAEALGDSKDKVRLPELRTRFSQHMLDLDSLEKKLETLVAELDRKRIKLPDIPSLTEPVK